MKEKIKKFEVFILRPAQLILILLVAIFAINKFWFLLVVGIVGLFYLGIIGSNLHPLQSAVDLAKGPLTNPVAKEELKTISPEQSNILVGHACTRVGILLGFGAGVIRQIANRGRCQDVKILIKKKRYKGVGGNNAVSHAKKLGQVKTWIY